MNWSIILPCACNHLAQDKMYGRGNRVHNISAQGYRCTVCRTIKKPEGWDKAAKELGGKKGGKQ